MGSQISFIDCCNRNSKSPEKVSLDNVKLKSENSTVVKIVASTDSSSGSTNTSPVEKGDPCQDSCGKRKPRPTVDRIQTKYPFGIRPGSPTSPTTVLRPPVESQSNIEYVIRFGNEVDLPLQFLQPIPCGLQQIESSTNLSEEQAHPLTSSRIQSTGMEFTISSSIPSEEAIIRFGTTHHTVYLVTKPSTFPEEVETTEEPSEPVAGSVGVFTASSIPSIESCIRFGANSNSSLIYFPSLSSKVQETTCPVAATLAAEYKGLSRSSSEASPGSSECSSSVEAVLRFGAETATTLWATLSPSPPILPSSRPSPRPHPHKSSSTAVIVPVFIPSEAPSVETAIRFGGAVSILSESPEPLVSGPVVSSAAVAAVSDEHLIRFGSDSSSISYFKRTLRPSSTRVAAPTTSV